MPRTRAIPTPIERASIMTRRETAPCVRSSICLLRICTAGSAATMKKPMTRPNGTRIQLLDSDAMAWPRYVPAGMNPMYTPVRKIVSPRRM